jgi:hypothetical protein
VSAALLGVGALVTFLLVPSRRRLEELRNSEVTAMPAQATPAQATAAPATAGPAAAAPAAAVGVTSEALLGTVSEDSGAWTAGPR